MQGSTIDPAKADLNHYHEATVATPHEEHPDYREFGVIVFLIAESMIFAGLFVAYLTFRMVSPFDPPELELVLPGVNTLILVASSFVLHQGVSAIKKNDVKGLQLWFGLTALMGAIFLAGQAYEYFHLEFGLKTNIFASTFYVLTGFHGLHVLCGIGLLAAVLLRSLGKSHYSKEHHFGVVAAEYYWHFVDVIWVILFLILYIY